MTDFAKLKASRTSNTAKLVESLKAPTQNKSYDDPRFWSPLLDREKGVGAAVIRFLPTKDDETLSYVTYFEHSFKSTSGKYYIERSLSSLGKEHTDSIADLNRRLWSTNLDANKKLASSQKRNSRYISNILVVNDPAKPENNGKVFLYKFGPKIFSFIEASLKPAVDVLTGEVPDTLDAYDMWEGANFEIRIANTQNGWSYDSSKFGKVSPVASNDTLIEAVFNQVVSLQEFVDVSNYKTNDVLNKRLIDVLGTSINGLETIVGYGIQSTSSNQTQSKPQEASAPRQHVQEAKIDNSVPFDIDEPKATFAKDADESFFESLMAEV